MPRPDVDRLAGLDARRLVAFKACVGELSRLSAGRGEDGALLAQISHDGAGAAQQLESGAALLCFHGKINAYCTGSRPRAPC